MQLNRYDMAVIEQALREAINQGADYHKVTTYQTVLGKLQEMDDVDARTTMGPPADGFRYDYDDSADTGVQG